MVRLAIFTCLLAPALLTGCVSRTRPAAPASSTVAYPAESYLQLGDYSMARDAGRAELAAARDRGDQAAILEAELRLGEALVGLESHREARGYLVNVLRNGGAARREDARALLALSHDRQGNQELALSYYREVRRDRVNPTLWSRVTRRFSSYVLGAAKPSVGPRHPSTASGAMPSIYPRSQWSREPVRTQLADRMETIRRITVHHTAMVAYPAPVGEVAEHLRSVQRQHFARDWADIGYHFVVDPNGRVWECRPLRYQGAHAGNHQLNRGNIGVSLMGDFNVQRVPDAQRQGLTRLLAGLSNRYRIPPSQILSHDRVRATECPGRHVSLMLPAVIRDLRLGASPSRVHRVARGDTLARIARHYGVSLISLRAVNPGRGNTLLPGDLIAVP